MTGRSVAGECGAPSNHPVRTCKHAFRPGVTRPYHRGYLVSNIPGAGGQRPRARGQEPGVRVRCSGIRAFGHSGIRAFGHSGIQAFRHSGVQAFRRSAIMGLRPAPWDESGGGRWGGGPPRHPNAGGRGVRAFACRVSIFSAGVQVGVACFVGLERCEGSRPGAKWSRGAVDGGGEGGFERRSSDIQGGLGEFVLQK